VKTERGKVTALDATKRAVRVERYWYYASEQELKRLRLHDEIEVTYVTKEGRRKVVDLLILPDGNE
jgi:hypothetical protein